MAKYDPEGNFVKPKARNCIAGHPGVMKKGEHYFATFAAVPRGDTTRVLQAISVGKGYSRSAFDINVAFHAKTMNVYLSDILLVWTVMTQKVLVTLFLHC